MTKIRQIILASALISVGAIEQASGSAPATCSSLISSSLISRVLMLSSTVALVKKPACEEVQQTTTCTATYYGKGDGFSGGTTACGNRFRPTVENTIAIKTASAGGFFDRSLCGKKAIVTSKDPRTGTTKSVEVRITDSGSMGGRTSKRCMDLSYKAASELGIVERGVASNTTIKVCK